MAVRAGQRFVLELDANPTTGFRWEAEFDPALLRLVTDDFMAGADRPGAGGYQRLWFEALRHGRGVLRLRYRSPWRPEVAREHVVALRISAPS
jgi:predicted secreted protein